MPLWSVRSFRQRLLEIFLAMGLQLGKDMALKDPKRGMMYFLIFSLMGFKIPKSVVPLVPKRLQSEVGSIDQWLKCSWYTWLHHAPECPGLFLDNLSQMHIGLIDAVKLDLNLLQKLVGDALEILESNSGSVVLISTTLHYNQEATSINNEQCSLYKTRSSCGREKHEKRFVSTSLRASSGSLHGLLMLLAYWFHGPPPTLRREPDPWWLAGAPESIAKKEQVVGVLPLAVADFNVKFLRTTEWEPDWENSEHDVLISSLLTRYSTLDIVIQ